MNVQWNKVERYITLFQSVPQHPRASDAAHATVCGCDVLMYGM